ncbi:MAG: tetratricopeptide repeat protein [Verrucomicrobiota bacterium]|jgi:TPR repeat protein
MNNSALVTRPASAIEKAAPGAKRVLARMVAEMIALAETKALLEFSPNKSLLLESWCKKGESYCDGRSVPKDFVEAARWFRMAAEKGHVRAQFWLGSFYQAGQLGIMQNWTEAVKWYRKAAEQGNADTQHNLGFCYYNGEGVQKNYTEAVNWFRKAAEQNLAQSQRILGLCYANGRGVEKDYAEAVKWYLKAAEQNNAKAQNNLGVCCENGKGVPQDFPEAYKFYKLAAEQNLESAVKSLKQVAARMTAVEIAEGERRVRKFRSQKNLKK